MHAQARYLLTLLRGYEFCVEASADLMLCIKSLGVCYAVSNESALHAISAQDADSFQPCKHTAR